MKRFVVNEPNMPADPMVHIQDLSFAFENRFIFKNITLTVPQGKIIGIIGPSGTGKTTLLRLIGAQLKPLLGQVLVKGVDIHALSQVALYKARRKMGLLFQSNTLFTHLTIFENVAFPLREHTAFDEDLIRDLVLMKLEAVGLRGVQHFMPAVLSGGMARRVALARALVFDPELMMYDEPFTGQDPISKGILLRLIKRTNELLGATTVLVSHDIEETCQIADYLYFMVDGQIVEQGEPALLKKSTLPRVKQFIHGDADGPVPFHYPTVPLAEELLDAHA